MRMVNISVRESTCRALQALGKKAKLQDDQSFSYVIDVLLKHSASTPMETEETVEEIVRAAERRP